MTFIHHNYLGDLELNCKTTESIRLYNLPSGKWVPSITSVTSFYNREIFVKWRKRVGLEEANRITKRATARGTDFHQVCQDYLENKELVWENYQPISKFMFHHAKPYLDKINNIHAIERTLFSFIFSNTINSASKSKIFGVKSSFNCVNIIYLIQIRFRMIEHKL